MILFALLATLLEQTHREVLRLVANQVELSQHKFDLLNELARARRLPKLDSFDEGRLELVAQDVCRLDLEDVITERDQVRDCVIFHICARFQECLHLPLLVVLWIQLLVAGARGDDCDIFLQSLENLGQEAISRKFNPALGGVGYDIDTPELLRLYHEVVCHVIQL